ncbi:MAG: hypothetical protein IPM69_01340 [Ignavibacteria bacterium]|nr:hypothetical protein [Ignavibacteria bacterium]
MSTILSKNEIQDLLPDYAFGKLAETEKVHFENSIPHYPELQSELLEIRNAFLKIENLQYDSSIDQRTRNLSLHVNERLNKKREIQFRVVRLTRYVIPIIGLAVLALFYIQPDESILSGNQPSIESANQIEIIALADAQMIISNDVNINAAIEETTQLITIPENIPESSHEIDELFASSLHIINDNSQNSILQNEDLWLNFTETELQDLLKDLSYENPSIL